MAKPLFLAAVALAMAMAGAADAHPLAPTLLELIQRDSSTVFDVLWKTSILRVPGSDLRPILPQRCANLDRVVAREQANSLIRRWSIDCGRRGLGSSAIGFSGLGPAKIDGLVRIQLANGQILRRVVRAAEPTWTIPQAEDTGEVSVDYLRLGFDQILTGLDHLLFVLGLLLLVEGTHTLVKTITAFTIGHSVTLSLAALGLLSFPTRPIQLAIALSVFLLAAELARRSQAEPSIMRRWPWGFALGFGLLHGLGFAGALADVGLPHREIPVALLSFNAGIEIGELTVVSTVLAVGRLLLPAASSLPRWAKMVPLYAMGSLAAFWCFQRLAAVVAA